jgi:choice-of-anchor A domain-containing protein
MLPMLALAATFGANAADAQSSAADYNLFVLGDMRSVGSDTEGRVAVCGNAYLQNYSVGAPLSNPTGYSLVVGGNLTANGGSTNGAMYVGGTSTFTSWSKAGLAPAGTADPVDFAAEAIRLKALTDTLADYVANGATNYVNWGGSHGGQLTLTGANAGLNVFSVDAAQLSSSNTFNIHIPTGATALINVVGTAITIGSGGFNVPSGASSILWNFAEATSLSFVSTNMTGSVLAPNAAYYGSAPIAGQLVVGSFTGRDWNVTQVNRGNYSGNLLSLDPTPPVVVTPPHGGDDQTAPVPEPTSWATMLAGFGLVGTALRRARRAIRLA